MRCFSMTKCWTARAVPRHEYLQIPAALSNSLLRRSMLYTDASMMCFGSAEVSMTDLLSWEVDVFLACMSTSSGHGRTRIFTNAMSRRLFYCNDLVGNGFGSRKADVHRWRVSP